MAAENEPAKLLLPYLQRADELQKHEPLVAYYCRLYAMEKGLRIPNSERTKTTNALLVSLMNQLEKDKKSLKLGPEDSLHLEGFALNVFAKADKQDRAGRADLNTAKTFYAASIFFEIINQFGPLQPDLEQKQKYAVWKAADIRKAVKEGRKPNPGPPNGDEDLSIPSSTPSAAYDLGPSEPAVTSHRQDSDLSPQLHDEENNQHYNNIPPPPQFHDKIDRQHSSNVSPSPPSYPSASYPSHDQSYPQEPQQHFHPPPPTSRSENPTYPYSYHHQPYPQEPQQHLSHSYPSHEAPSYTYPNFQSYPSFSESSLPSTTSHYPSYYQGSETPYTPQSAPPATSYPSTAQYSSSSKNGTVSEPAPTASQKYQYDSNYQPPPEKIAEAHKAARFAVGALAFDDVSVAVEHLKKSLELLTNPSASQ
ncbi:protein HOMOLOG OF MAMMALIAN LYST-INTERACTING PROTEIN 5-like [Durio zibethinus]|uniref:Protein HOMOLOG OF MAMMALIAN LYST-INTERACTING PROTEIN 5-like n=1 Tax=Durio zibethinus TaxID=66656 RepID=A0A6P5Y3L1_DURZI|nr:protein HOMOLOG OF MAMMALIAN LYST-INTERACTING PROTEIN 5-like [Durio zibethinus]